MFLKYFILGIVQLALLIFAAPIVIGFFAGLIKPKQAPNRLWHIAIGMVIVLDIATWIDKGLPFFAGQILNAYLYTPLDTAPYLLVGLMLDFILVLSFRQSLKSGVNSGVHMSSIGKRTTQSKNK